MNSDGPAGTNNDANKHAIAQEQIKRLQSKYESECRMRRDLLNQLMEVKGNIRVLARIRPLQSNEEPSPLETSDEWTLHAPLTAQVSNAPSLTPTLSSSLSAPSLSAILPSTTLSSHSGASSTSSALSASANASLLNKKFQFDRVFGPETTQAEVFEEVAALPISLLDGYNCCLFAYGQTGSGKTFTMEGATDSSTLNSTALEATRGLTYRILSCIFEEAENRPHMEYFMQVSVMEIYNEAIIDLLDMDLQTQTKFGASVSAGGLKLRQGENGICVPEATRRTVKKWSEIEEAMEAAKRVRSVASTDMNEHSSRSHCVTCLEVCGRRSKSANMKGSNIAGSADEVTHSRLFLIDLAGSERISQSGAQGKALDEARHINKSLSALSRVMECLQQKRQHIPFRDSTLTHLLKDTLIDAKTVMMLNLSPAAVSYGQTVNSLNFGVRVRKIERTAPKRNFDLDRAAYNASKTEMETEVSKLKTEVQRLSTLLSQAKMDSNHQQQAIQAKHIDTIAHLKQQITQNAITHSAEIATLSSTHEREVAALKKALAEAKLVQPQAKSAETLTGPLLQKTTSLVLPRPTPALIASSIVSQQLQPLQAPKLGGILDKGTKEIDPESENKNNENSTNPTSAKDKYIHQTTPIKPKSLSVLQSSALQGSEQKKFDSPSSKLSSPIVVVDELQKMYLKQQMEGNPNRSTFEGEIPIMDENGILLPVVMTPQLSKRTTIATASPIGFTALGPTRPKTSTSILETSIFDDDGFLSRSTTDIPMQTPLSIPVIPSPSQSPPLEQTKSEITIPRSQSPLNATLPTSTASTLRVSSDSNGSTGTKGVSTGAGSNLANFPSVAIASAPTVSALAAPKEQVKSILVPRGMTGRVRKKVTFCETLDFFGPGNLKLPIRSVTTLPPSLTSISSANLNASSLSAPVATIPATTSNASLAQAHPATAKSVTSTTGSSGAVRPMQVATNQPASPIKSVAVRPMLSASSTGTGTVYSSSLCSNPGARRVVAKHTSNLQVVPKATPARVRPIGRTTAPLTGAPAVYKTY